VANDDELSMIKESLLNVFPNLRANIVDCVKDSKSEEKELKNTVLESKSDIETNESIKKKSLLILLLLCFCCCV